MTTTTETTTIHNGELQHLNPADLHLEINVRTEARLTAEFVQSIAEHGVLTPIVAVRDDSGTVQVRAGQRRTLAARQAGLASVPVYIRDTSSSDDPARTGQRVAQQFVENKHREELTAVEHADAIQQMLDTGLSVSKTAKALAAPKKTVEAVKKLAGSTTAADAFTSAQLTLEEAAAYAEFDDMPEASGRLAGADKRGGLAHVVSQLRQEQRSRRARSLAEQPYRDAGYTVLDQPVWGVDREAIPLERLNTSHGVPASEDDITDPQQWGVWLDEAPVLRDTATGEDIDAETIDWSTEDDPGADAADGYRHFNTVTEHLVYEPDYYCRDVAAAGLAVQDGWLSWYGLNDANTAGVTDEASKKEAESRQRRKVLALNKLGKAAEQVRREYIATLLRRKTLPKGAGVFVAHTLALDPAVVTERGLTAELLGAAEGRLDNLVDELPASGDARAQVIVLGLVLGGLEARTPKDAWRGRGWHKTAGKQLLAFLADNGYQLAPIENVITGELTADELFDDMEDNGDYDRTDDERTDDERGDG